MQAKAFQGIDIYRWDAVRDQHHEQSVRPMPYRTKQRKLPTMSALMRSSAALERAASSPASRSWDCSSAAASRATGRQHNRAQRYDTPQQDAEM